MHHRAPPKSSCNEGRVYERTDSGKFKKGCKQYAEAGMTPEHKEKVRKAAILRANTHYRKISVCGVVYPNVTQAASAVGVSARALRMYAESISVIFDHIFYVGVDKAALRNTHD